MPGNGCSRSGGAHPAPVAAVLSGCAALRGHGIGRRGAQPRFDTVGDAATIPQSVVSALAQDREGRLWIGTGAGLVRHDGYSFRSQTTGEAGHSGHGLGFVRSMLMARDGRLWVGTESDGLAVLDPAPSACRSIAAIRPKPTHWHPAPSAAWPKTGMASSGSAPSATAWTGSTRPLADSSISARPMQHWAWWMTASRRC